MVVTLLDYGSGNILNVVRALKHVGINISVAKTSEEILKASSLVVPGVGAFSDCMSRLENQGLDEAIKEFASTGKPLIGICLGMQILFESSNEFGYTQGLGLISGEVRPIVSEKLAPTVRIPHIGWNSLVPPEGHKDWQCSQFSGLETKSLSVYFVHSFAAFPTDQSDRLADCIYEGNRICAAVSHENILGFQFHPERSGKTGLQILRKFVKM